MIFAKSTLTQARGQAQVSPLLPTTCPQAPCLVNRQTRRVSTLTFTSPSSNRDVLSVVWCVLHCVGNSPTNVHAPINVLASPLRSAFSPDLTRTIHQQPLTLSSSVNLSTLRLPPLAERRTNTTTSLRGEQLRLSSSHDGLSVLSPHGRLNTAPRSAFSRIDNDDDINRLQSASSVQNASAPISTQGGDELDADQLELLELEREQEQEDGARDVVRPLWPARSSALSIDRLHTCC